METCFVFLIGLCGVAAIYCLLVCKECNDEMNGEV